MAKDNIKKMWEVEKKINHSVLNHYVTDFISKATDDDMILDADKAVKWLDEVIDEYKKLLDETKNLQNK